MLSTELQSLFLSHFTDKEHKLVSSSSVIPYSDATLLFVNSGMVQFKPYFSSQTDLPYSCATSSQRCIRAGGKHNDLDDVGKDSYHHTFFMMLGNWSFGKYFKKEAIDYAWDFLVNVLKLDKDRIYVSYYSCDDGSGPNYVDTETRDYWLMYLSQDRVLPFGPKENFWEMGDIGPCGPCTEIHYDSRDNPEGGADFVNQDHPDVIEIWNIVFMEYFRNPDKSLSELKTKCIDTGMGMERVLRIVNGLKSNYLTDPFQVLILEIEKEMKLNNKLIRKINNINLNGEKNNFNGGLDLYSSNDTFKIYTDSYDPQSEYFTTDMAMRVISDHSRTIAICLFDGVMFSSVGRGYVVRRIMRRAIKYCNVLEIKNKMHNFIQLAGQTIGITLTHEMLENARAEESLFLKTLEKGKALLYRKQDGIISGKEAFTLYDTYGFPIDLTELICEERGILVDRAGFEVIMEESKEKSRKKRASEEEVISYKGLNKLERFPKTEDNFKYSENNIKSKVLCILRGNDIVYEFDNGEDVHNKSLIFDDDVFYSLVCESTCFYSESGGQVGDRGWIKFTSNEAEIGCADVYETMKLDGFVFHLFKGDGLLLNDFTNLDCVLVFNQDHREKITKNHTGTHLLNHTLRKYLSNVEQKGSLVDDQKLRFDYSGSKGLTSEQIKVIEDYMNNIIDMKVPIHVTLENINNAKQLEGIIYITDEKYPETVRVITIDGITSELCAGTHLKNTGDIQRIRIISESNISSNVRRIVAVTGNEAFSCEKNLTLNNPLDLQIPLYERLLLNNINQVEEKQKVTLGKEALKSNLERISLEIDHYKNTGIINSRNIYSMDSYGFIFECDFQPNKNNIKYVNKIALILDKEKVDGFVYHISNETIVFSFRGENALERGRKFVEFLGNGTINGKDRCSNGSAVINKPYY